MTAEEWRKQINNDAYLEWTLPNGKGGKFTPPDWEVYPGSLSDTWSVTLQKKSLEKSYSPTNHTLSWKLTLNSNHVNLQHFSLKDTLNIQANATNPYHQILTGLSSTDGKTKVTLDDLYIADTTEDRTDDYQVDETKAVAAVKKFFETVLQDPDPNAQKVSVSVTLTKDSESAATTIYSGKGIVDFTITVDGMGKYSTDFNVESTIVDPKFTEANIKNAPFYNEADMNDFVVDKAILEGTALHADAKQNHDNRMLDKEIVSYDPQTHILGWKLHINRDKTEIHDVVITDTLPEHLSYYTDGSHKTELKVGNQVIDSGRYEVNYDEGTRVITVTLHDLVNRGEGTLSFFTKADFPDEETNVKAEHDFTNTASLVSRELPDPTNNTVTATAKIQNNTTVKKLSTDESKDNLYHFKITLNPNNLEYTPKEGEQIRIEDYLPTGATSIDLDSVALYAAESTSSLNKDGVFVTKTEKAKDAVNLATENNVDYVQDQDGQDLLTVVLPEGKLERAYILEYDMYVTKTSATDFTLTNKADLVGFNKTTDGKDSDSEEIKIRGNSGGTLLPVSNLNIKVRKSYDGTPKTQAVFGIWDIGNQSDGQVLATATVDAASGIASFSVPFNVLRKQIRNLNKENTEMRIVLKELSAPDGYGRSSQKATLSLYDLEAQAYRVLLLNGEEDVDAKGNPLTTFENISATTAENGATTVSLNLHNDRVDNATVNVSMKKTWEDFNNVDGSRDGVSLEVTLYENDGTGWVKSTKDKAGNAIENPKTLQASTAGKTQDFTWKDMAMYAKDGTQIEYRLEETGVPEGYTVSYAKEDTFTDSVQGEEHTAAEPTLDNKGNPSFAITNRHIPHTTVQVTKIWKDGSNYDEMRKAFTVTLYRREVGKNNWEAIETPADVSETKAYEFSEKDTLTEEERGISCKWEDLPLYSEDGTIHYEYKVEETPLENYDDPETEDVNKTANTESTWKKLFDFLLTNKRTPVTSITVNKNWKDGGNADNSRKVFTVTLYRMSEDDEAPNEVQEVQVDPNVSTYTFSNLPLFNDNDKLYTYSVDETTVPADYTKESVKQTMDDKHEKEFLITNSYHPKASVTINKEWKDVDNVDETRAEYQVTLYRDGEPAEDVTDYQVTLPADTLTYTWSDLERFDIEQEPDQVHEYEYTVEETLIPEHYTAEIKRNEEDSTDNSDVYDITNTYLPLIDITVNKTWDDYNDYDNLRGSYTVTLYRNGEFYESVKLKKNELSYTWNDLLRYDEDDALYEYTLKETVIPSEYTASVESENIAREDNENPQNTGMIFSVTNKHILRPRPVNKPSLPNTGLNWWPVWILGGAGLLVWLYALVRRK